MCYYICSFSRKIEFISVGIASSFGLKNLIYVTLKFEVGIEVEKSTEIPIENPRLDCDDPISWKGSRIGL